jgi:hypothetical protein
MKSSYLLKSFYTAISYRASAGPEQDFSCVVFPHSEKLHRENPVFITGTGLQCRWKILALDKIKTG